MQPSSRSTAPPVVPTSVDSHSAREAHPCCAPIPPDRIPGASIHRCCFLNLRNDLQSRRIHYNTIDYS